VTSDSPGRTAGGGSTASDAIGTETTPTTRETEKSSDDAVERRLADALEQVAHGVTVSVPAILL
jgi:hypothetical protein